MPFRSEAQRRFLWMKHPDIAEKWTAEHGSKIVPSKHPVAEAIKRRRRKQENAHGG
jgi:hypothetical protein